MKYLISVCLLFCAPFGFALGLGDASLETRLNEPLLVKIPVLSPGEITAEELKVKIASDEIFKSQGVERTYIHSSLRTRVVQTGPGNWVVEVYTREPFKEAWINFLLDVRWPKGKLVKNVNLLLDLPKN